MKKFVLAAAAVFVSVVSVAAHAQTPSSNDQQNYEVARKAAVAHSKNATQLMDNATPEELAKLLNLKPGQNGEMISEKQLDWFGDIFGNGGNSGVNNGDDGGDYDNGQQPGQPPHPGHSAHPAPVAPGYPTTGSAVEISVSIATQSLQIDFPEGTYSTVISSARAGYHTVTGCYTHPHLELMHYSSKYENSPMPHAMFFYGGYAIHGTLEENELGRPASHGCVRVSQADATYLYSIVEHYGAANTRICIR